MTCPSTYFQFHLVPLHFNCTGLLPVLLWPPLSFEPEDHITNYLLDISPVKCLINTTNCICILTSFLRPQIGVTLKFSSPLMYTTQNSSDTVIALLQNLHQPPMFQRKTSRRSVFQRKLNRIQNSLQFGPHLSSQHHFPISPHDGLASCVNLARPWSIPRYLIKYQLGCYCKGNL